MPAELNKLVSIIIVTVGRCLDSVKKQTYPHLEVIIINNSSDTRLADKVLGQLNSARVYSPRQNLFYCASLNKGIELSQGEFVLCLNDDIVLDKDFIQEALKGFLLKKSVGMVSGKILRQDGLTLDSTGLFLSIWRTAKERGYGQPDSGQFEKSEVIFGVNGAAAFYRKSMLEEIREGQDYFDPDFRIFYEDLDIAWRANRYGWQAYYIPKALAYHVRGGSFRPNSGLGKAFARRYLSDELHSDLIKNRYLAILKNETKLSLFGHLVPIILHDLCAWAYVLFFRPKALKIFLTKSKCLFRSKRSRPFRMPVRQ